MCGIFITRGMAIERHLELAELMNGRGIHSVHMLDEGYETCVTHRLLPLQENSRHQPFVDKEGNHLYLVGELYGYDTDRGEIETLYETLTRDEWYYDWEGDLIRFNRMNMMEIYVDPLRKRPLFRYENGNFLAISNDLKVIANMAGMEIDERYLGIVQRQGFCYDNTTPFKGVNIIPPGLTIYMNGGELNHFPPPAPETYDFNKIGLDEEIYDAIYNRVKRDHNGMNFGIYLSGGNDSCLIADVIGNIYGGENKIPAIIIKNLCGEEELSNIEKIKKNYNHVYDFKIINITQPEFISNERVIKEFVLPVDLGSVRPQIAMAEVTKQLRWEYRKLHVIITGDGADELFGGYKRNLQYDSQMYDIFVELIHYHNIRLDQIPFNYTIELRTPLQALPVLERALSIPYEMRKNKKFLRELSGYETPKVPLKVLGSDPMKYRLELINEFRRQYGSVHD